MSAVGRLGALKALILLAGCGAPPLTVADLWPTDPEPPAATAEDTARRQRAEVVLGLRLVGGTQAHRVAPPPSSPLELAPGAAPDPVERARADLHDRTRRALAVQQLLEIWARADGPERKNKPDAVRQAQRLLSALGYYEGPVTGVNGPLSTAAIRKFQAIQGLPETGDVTASLLVALRAAL